LGQIRFNRMAQNIVFKVSADTTGIKTGMEQAGNATKKVSQNVSSLETQFKSLADSIQNAFSIGSVVEFGKAVYKVSAEIQSLQVRLNSISGGNNQGMVAMQDLSKMANKLGLDFVGLADNFVQFVGAAKASGMEVRKAEQIFKSMSVAIAGSGANAETAKRAMTALTQMIGKGKISAEELRGQLGEAMPQAFGIMAKSLGVTTQQLDKMMADGKLLANDVLPKFAKEMEKAFGADAQKLAEGMQANVNRLNNAWQNYMATLGERFYGSMGGAQVLADMLEWWTKINLTHEQYMSRETARLLNSSQEKQSAEATLESLKSQGKTLDQLVHSFKVLRDTEMEFAKSIKDTDAKGYVNSVKMAQAYDMILKSVENELALSKVKVPLTEAQIKALEKERKEREKIALEMRKALEAGMKMQLEAELEYQTKVQKGRKELSEMLRVDINQDPIATPFESEMKRLDRLRRRDEINEEEYLNRKLEIQRKYGQNSVETFDQIYALTNRKAQEEKDAKIQFGVDTFNGLSQLANTFYQRDLAKQSEALQKRLEIGELSEQQYAEALRQIKRKQMVADKIAAISQIAINTAVNVSKASATPPLIPGIITAGIIQSGIVLAQPVPYNKGTKRVPMMRGAIRGKDSVHAILTPDERVVPADINTQPGYSALFDLAQDRKISDKEAGFIAEMAMGGRASSNQPALDPDVIGKAIAKYIPHTSVKINERGIAVITEQSRSEIRRLKSRIG
jgi:tape measure domain-containing protein